MNQYEKTSDVELVTLSLVDKECFSYLVRRYQDKIYRYIKRISSFSDDLVGDIIQNTFIKTYINLNSFDTRMQFSSWLYRIAHNETISFLRKNKKHIEATLFPDDSMELFLSDIHIENTKHGSEMQELLWKAINQLKQKYRDIIILKYFEHKSYDEISDIIQKPPGTVATWLSRAKGDIKKFLVLHNYTHHE